MRGNVRPVRPCRSGRTCADRTCPDAGGRRLGRPDAPDLQRRVSSQPPCDWRHRATAGESSLSRQIIYMAEGARIAARARDLAFRPISTRISAPTRPAASYARLLGACASALPFTALKNSDNTAALIWAVSWRWLSSARPSPVMVVRRRPLAAPGDWDKVQVVHCGLDLGRWDTLAAKLPDGPSTWSPSRFCRAEGLRPVDPRLRSRPGSETLNCGCRWSAMASCARRSRR